ncbi:class A beta-lactamase-related serine hydrolase, partial [Thiopseudomonas sp. 4R-3cl]
MAYMRRARIIILLVVLIVLSGWWGTQHWHGYIFWQGSCNGDKPEWFNKLVTLAREQGYPGFQLSLQAKDGSRLNCSAGQVGPGLNLKAIQTNHRIRYVSLSKLFTSIVSQQLIAEERLLADSYLLDYFGSDFVVQDERVRKITIGQLLRHTSGFDRNLTPDPMMEPEPWCPFQLEKLSHIVLDHDPGSRYAYSNLGYCLLGAVIERIEGTTLPEIFKNRIFMPASVASLAPAKRWQFANDEVAYHYQHP